jgi:hypothetical protein
MKHWLAVAAFGASVEGFYLPGVAPRTFRYGDRVSQFRQTLVYFLKVNLRSFPLNVQVELKVNKMASIHTQVPYDYYALRFCKPRGGVQQVKSCVRVVGESRCYFNHANMATFQKQSTIFVDKLIPK